MHGDQRALRRFSTAPGTKPPICTTSWSRSPYMHGDMAQIRLYARCQRALRGISAISRLRGSSSVHLGQSVPLGSVHLGAFRPRLAQIPLYARRSGRGRPICTGLLGAAVGAGDVEFGLRALRRAPLPHFGAIPSRMLTSCPERAEPEGRGVPRVLSGRSGERPYRTSAPSPAVCWPRAAC